MKDKDSQLIAEAYSQEVNNEAIGAIAAGLGKGAAQVGKAGIGAVGALAKGTGKAAMAAAPAVGKAAGKIGLAGAGVAAKTAGIGLEGILKALNFLSAEQLKKVGDAALKKAAENEEYEQDDNDQYALEEAPADDQLGEMQPLDDEDNEEMVSRDIANSLEDVVGELKTLNQYVDFMTTGSRSPGFTSPLDQQKKRV
jgi:hypothetical protein